MTWKAEIPSEGGGECRYVPELVAYLQGELDSTSQTALSAHLPLCSLCQEELERLQEVFAEFAAVAEHPSPELQQRTVSTWRSWLERTRPVMAFGFLGLLVAGAIIVGVNQLAPDVDDLETTEQDIAALSLDERTRLVKDAARWLCSIQSSDGAFRPSAGGGSDYYVVGVTGLAIAALASIRDWNETEVAALDRGVHFLLSQQNEDGSISASSSGRLYNHAPATLGLLLVSSSQAWPALASPKSRALAYLLKTQDESGGWGYLDGSARPPNTSITTWCCSVLKVAEVQGHTEVAPALAKAARWIASCRDEKGRLGYEHRNTAPHGRKTLDALDAYLSAVIPSPQHQTEFPAPHDYIGAFFLAESRASVSHPIWAFLYSRFVDSGPQRGSFRGNDRWSEYGGSVCATSLSMLALRHRIP